jgi:hypothetical protein
MMLSTLTLVLSLAAGASSEETLRVFKSAEFAMSEHRWNDALVLAEHLLKQAPNAWQGHKIAGEALMQLDRPREAVPHLKRWAELQPDNPRAAQSASLAEKKVAGTFKAAGEAAGGLGSSSGGSSAGTNRTPPAPSLGEVARQRAETADKAPGAAKPGAAPAEPAPLPTDVDEVTLDTMRKRADKVLRPRMGAVATSMKQLRSTSRLFRGQCHKQQLGLAGREILTYGSEAAWVQNWSVPENVAFDTSPQCVTLASDIKGLTAKVAGALRGVDRQLAVAPAVYPAVKEEVFGKLAQELW